MKRVDVPVIDRTETKHQLIKNIEVTILDILKQINRKEIPKVSFLNNLSLGENDIYASDTESDETENGVENDIIMDNIQIELNLSNNNNNNNNIESIVKKNKKNENREINFNTEMRRKQMVRLMVILSKSYKLLMRDKIQTKRSLYYELKGGEYKELFEKQSTVERVIATVANLFTCATWDLGFVATAEGLVCGDLKLIYDNGNVIDCCNTGGALIPPIRSTNNCQLMTIETTANAIIIVEKEAIFHKLLTENLPTKLSAILITGKGYPDKATRVFVKLLENNLHLPVYILVDGNPHGFEIMCSYKYGSRRILWEKGDLTCSKIKWIGVYPSEMVNMRLPTMPMTPDDLKKLKYLKQRSYLSKREREELNIYNVEKTEIEALASISPYFLTSTYIPTKINNYNNIHKYRK